MSLTLILIRHAKSEWDDPTLADHDRPLNARGRQAAPRIGAWLTRQGMRPSTVLCSTARRTQETWSGIAPHLDVTPQVEFSKALYHASPEELLAFLALSDGDAIAVIGHNPGIGSLAQALAAKAPPHPKFGLYPTGATTILRFQAESWDQIRPGQGQVIAFTTPRDLPDPAS